MTENVDYGEFSPQEEAPADARYFVDNGGSTIRVPAQHASLAREQGYLPASEDQVKAYDSAREQAKKYGGIGGALASGIQSAGSLLTFGGTDVLQAKLAPYLPTGTLHTAEELQALHELHPVASAVGTAAALVPGVLAGLAGKGLSALGAEGAAQALKTAVPGAVGAPAAIGELGAALSRQVGRRLPEATGWASAAARGVAQAAPSLALESGLYGVQNVVHEQALGDPRSVGEALVSEVGPDTLFGAALAVPFGIGGGLLSHLKGLAAEGRYPLALKDKEAIAVAHALGDGASTKRVTNSMIDTLGPEGANQALRDMGDLGFGSPASTARQNMELADTIKKSQGIEDLIKDVSSTLSPDKQPQWAGILQKIKDEALAPLEESSFNYGESAAKSISRDLSRLTGNLKEGVSLEDLYRLRRDADAAVKDSGGFGDEGAKAYNMALRKVRNIFADEMTAAVERSGRPASDLTDRLRRYQLAEYASDFADAAGKERFGPPSGNGLGIGSGAFVGYHLASGLGGGALPLATVSGAMVGRAASSVAQRYAPGLLAWALRRLRNGVSYRQVAAELEASGRRADREADSAVWHAAVARSRADAARRGRDAGPRRGRCGRCSCGRWQQPHSRRTRRDRRATAARQ
ncbi:MAG: hypothetical protein ACHQ5A_02380 [Opitutales bacterium]